MWNLKLTKLSKDPLKLVKISDKFLLTLSIVGNLSLQYSIVVGGFLVNCHTMFFLDSGRCGPPKLSVSTETISLIAHSEVNSVQVCSAHPQLSFNIGG